jgi:hypothetical protein
MKDEKKPARGRLDEIGRQAAKDYEPGAMRRIQNNRFCQTRRI